MEVVPLLNDVGYTFNLELAGTTYVFRVIWNDLFEFYTMQIEELSRDILISGIKLVLGTELILKYVDPSLPPGALVVVDTNPDNTRLTFNSFRETASLVFVPEGELSGII